MKSLFRVFAVAAVVGGMTLGVQSIASAQHGHGGSHNRGYQGGYQTGGYSGNYGGGNYGGVGINYRSSYGPTWHNTSHYEYHPGGYQPHRNHAHYVPGHYDYHRSGHRDW